MSDDLCHSDVRHASLRHVTLGSRSHTFINLQVSEVNYSSNEARFPAKLRVDQSPAGQCSIGDDAVHLWYGEIQAGHVRER